MMDVRPIPAYPHYRACENGDIIGPSGFILRPKVMKTGYLSVGIYHDGRQFGQLVHRLIASAFLGLDINDSSMEVDHIDNIRNHNHKNNLQILTASQNTSKSFDHLFADDTATHKRCRRCGEIKARAFFAKRANSRDGHVTWCRECKKKPHEVQHV